MADVQYPDLPQHTHTHSLKALQGVSGASAVSLQRHSGFDATGWSLYEPFLLNDNKAFDSYAAV